MIALAYIPVCILLAWWNARLIKKGKRIYHALNGLLHLSVAALFGYFVGWKSGLSILFIARLVFDTSLNLMRGLPIDYVPLKPKSIVDKIEKKIFDNNGLSPKILYLLFIIILLAL